jgi:hypothetical protein
MPKNQVRDPITDREIAFADLILSGTMTDRRAAEAVGLDPETAAYTKGKPRVRTYMLEHRAAMNERRMQQETEELRRLKQSRERVLARLWKIADLDPEMTRNSMSAQMKAISMIVAIEGLIPNRNDDRRAGSAQNKSAPSTVHPHIDTDAWLCEQQEETTGPQPNPDPIRDEDGPGAPDLPPGATAGPPSDLGPTHGPDSGQSESIFARPFIPAETAPPGKPVTSSIEKKPDTWRLRL